MASPLPALTGILFLSLKNCNIGMRIYPGFPGKNNARPGKRKRKPYVEL